MMIHMKKGRTVEISKACYNQLKEFAEKQNRSIDSVIEDAVLQFMSKLSKEVES